MRKNNNGQDVILPYDLLDNEFTRISAAARALYINIKFRQGNNPNHIPFSYTDLVSPMARSTYYRALRELCDIGLIAIKVRGSFPRKKHILAITKYQDHEYLD